MTIEIPRAMHKTLVSEFLNMIPESKSFNQILSYTFPSIDMMFDHEEFINKNQDAIDTQNFHDEFVMLMVRSYFLHKHYRLMF